MAKFVVLMMAAVACVAYVNGVPIPEVCAGCVVDQPADQFPEALTRLKAALTATHTNSNVKKILSYETQLVSGESVTITYLDTTNKTCTASWLEQSWITSAPQNFALSCY